MRYFTTRIQTLNDGVESGQKQTNLSSAQKLIEFSFEPDSFRIRQLGGWLMRNNRHFLSFYSDSKARTPIGARVANNDRLIKACINDFVSARLLVKTDTVKALKNDMNTPLYSLSIEGQILLLIIIKSGSGKYINQHILFHLIQQFLLSYKSHIMDFLANLYSKILSERLGESMIKMFTEILQTDIKIKNVTDILNITLHTHLMHPNTKERFLGIYMKTLDELDNKVKQIIICHEKSEIESRIHLYQPPKEWEEIWIRNTSKHDKIVLLGICQKENCLKQYPIVIDYYSYRNEISSDGFLKRRCIKCNTKDSLDVFNSLERRDIQARLN